MEDTTPDQLPSYVAEPECFNGYKWYGIPVKDCNDEVSVRLDCDCDCCSACTKTELIVGIVNTIKIPSPTRTF